MSTYSKEFLSNSTNGGSVRVTAVSAALTNIHTTEISNTIKDELWLYASNPHTFDINLYVMIGGSSFVDDVAFYGTIEAYAGNVLVIPGLAVRGDGVSGNVIRGNVSSVSGVNVFGYVNRITP